MLVPIVIQHGCSHPVFEMNKQKHPSDDPLMQASGTSGELSLPTLQRNALRKLFNRPDFTPHEVLALGYRNLQRAEGIGSKGLLAIIEWLAGHGLELKSPQVPADPPVDIPESVQRNINVAVRLLRTHGYRVQRTKDKIPFA